MRKILFLSLFGVVIFIPAIVIGGTYYVTQNGAGLQNGLNLGNAWSVENFNSSSNWSEVEDPKRINPGDTVYFSGAITSQIKPAGSGRSGKYITLDGWEAGTTNPVRDGENTSACLVYSNIKPASFHIEAKNYIIVQDFRFTNDAIDTGHMAFYAAKYNASSQQRTTNIIVRRNYFKGIGGKAVYFGWADDCTFGGARGDGNVTVDCGIYNNFQDKQHLTLYNTTGQVVSYNKMGNDDLELDLRLSQNIFTIHGTLRCLIEYNEIYNAQEQAGVSIKEGGIGLNQDIIARFNKIHNNNSPDGRAFSPDRHSNRVYIYGNLFVKNLRGLTPAKDAVNVFFWSNVIAHEDSRAIDIAMTTQTSWSVDNMHIYNNTVFGSGRNANSVSKTGLRVQDLKSNGYGVFERNNIYANNGYKPYYVQKAFGSTSSLDVDYNLIYHEGGTPQFTWGGLNLSHITTLAGVQAHGIEKNTIIADPMLVNPYNYDYSLSPGSSAIGSGVIVSDTLLTNNDIEIQGVTYSMSFSEGINPNKTDWSQTPPLVSVIKRSPHSWDMGAYVYTKENSGVVKLLPPKNFSLDPASTLN